jgi:hypothetical protein
MDVLRSLFASTEKEILAHLAPSIDNFRSAAPAVVHVAVVIAHAPRIVAHTAICAVVVVMMVHISVSAVPMHANV